MIFKSIFFIFIIIFNSQNHCAQARDIANEINLKKKYRVGITIRDRSNNKMHFVLYCEENITFGQILVECLGSDLFKETFGRQIKSAYLIKIDDKEVECLDRETQKKKYWTQKVTKSCYLEIEIVLI